MLVLVVIAAAAGCLLIGLLTGQTPLSWVALGLSVVGLLVLASSTWLARRGGAGAAEDPDQTVVEQKPADAAAIDVEPAEPPATEQKSADVAGAEAKPAEAAPVEQRPAAAARANGEPAEAAAADEKPAAVASTNGKPAGAGPVRSKAPRKSAKAKEPSVANPPSEQAQAPTAQPAAGPQVVRVIPGRRRFHVDGCRFLAGRTSEEIGLDQARNEGYSACSVCIPNRASLVSAPQ